MKTSTKRRNGPLAGALALTLMGTSSVILAADKPNVLAIMVDDVAQTSLSAYSHGMQYPTPNIDRIANEGALFTDHYAQPAVQRAALRSLWASYRYVRG